MPRSAKDAAPGATDRGIAKVWVLTDAATHRGWGTAICPLVGQGSDWHDFARDADVIQHVDEHRLVLRLEMSFGKMNIHVDIVLCQAGENVLLLNGHIWRLRDYVLEDVHRVDHGGLGVGCLKAQL